MKEIPLTQGKVALVSDHRYEYLMQWKWHARHRLGGGWDAGRTVLGHKTVLMHRVIMNAPESVIVDHADGDGLNNVDENLRACTKTENNRNRRINKNNTHSFKGVSKRPNCPIRPYKARIHVNGKLIHLGHFSTAEDAARAYDAAAKVYFGNYAKTNY
jgi:hypothetical protein